MKIITEAEVRSFSQYIGNIKSAIWVDKQGEDTNIIFCSDFEINELELLGFTEAVRQGLECFQGLDIKCKIYKMHKSYLNPNILCVAEYFYYEHKAHLYIDDVIKSACLNRPEHYQEYVKNTFENAQDYILVEYHAKSRMDKSWLWKLFNKRKLEVRLIR